MVMMAPRNRNRRSSAAAATANQGQSATEPEAAAATSSSSSSQRGSSSRSKRSNAAAAVEAAVASAAEMQDKESDEYRLKRERNNLAVKKSRSKSKMKTQETLERVNKLRAENEMLEAKIQLLSKELGFLKDLFLAHAGNAHSQALQDLDLSMFGEPTEAGLALMTNRKSAEENKTASSLEVKND